MHEHMIDFTVGVNAKLYTHFSNGTVREIQRCDEYSPELIRRFRGCGPGVAVALLCAFFKDSHGGQDLTH